MKITKWAVCVMLLLPALATAEIKIGVIDPLTAIAETAEVKTRTGKMEQDIKTKQAELEVLRSDIMEIEEKLKKDGLTMSKDAQKELADKRDAKMLDFRSRQQLAQRSVEEGRNEMLQLMEPRLKQAIDEVVKDKKLDLVINRQAALHVSEAMDITREVTQKMNQMK